MDDNINSEKPKPFIEFIDTYSKQFVDSKLDYDMLSNIIKIHYAENRLFQQPILPSMNHSNLFSPYKKKYSNHFTYYTHFPEQISHDPYLLWQKKHEIQLNVNDNPLTPIEKKKVTIDVSINTIDDILSIIHTFPYCPDTEEYNIDLKSLHSIKQELQELNNMIGMKSLKQSIVEQLVYFLQDLHLTKNTSEFKHTAIFGPPGTGKTEIAKIIGKMYSKMGILSKNIFKKVTRNDLIAGYLGQTAIKTKNVIEDCLGGVLFIDEVYSLANEEKNDSFSKECIDILCESLSDHKNDLMVIIAGYEEEVKNTFFRINQGLESRFLWRFVIDQYTPDEMCQIFKKKVIEQEWSFQDKDVIQVSWFTNKKDNFKNYGRDMELLLVYVKIAHGKRIFGKPVELKRKLDLVDMNAGYEIFLKNKKTKNEFKYLDSLYI
jgi:hypothetical protein